MSTAAILMMIMFFVYSTAALDLLDKPKNQDKPQKKPFKFIL